MRAVILLPAIAAVRIAAEVSLCRPLVNLKNHTNDRKKRFTSRSLFTQAAIIVEKTLLCLGLIAKIN